MTSCWTPSDTLLLPVPNDGDFFQPDAPRTKDGQNTLMTLSSMTGFARADGRHAHYAWQWEIKSVNGKGLDVRCRLPNGMDTGRSKRLRMSVKGKTYGFTSMARSPGRGDHEVGVDAGLVRSRRFVVARSPQVALRTAGRRLSSRRGPAHRWSRVGRDYDPIGG